MARPRQRRRVHNKVNFDYFKPRGVPLKELKEVNLNVEELEAIRFKDYEEMEQTEAAKKMNVSQPTFHRVLKEARKKVADALLNGKAIKIQGGNYQMPNKDGTGPLGKGPRTGRGIGRGQGRGGGRGMRGGFGVGQMPQTNVKSNNVKLKDKMKVIITATSETIDSKIDSRFGRCPYFVIVEIENKEIKNVTAVKNQGHEQQQSAGIVAGEQVANLKPDAIITGNLGPNAYGILSQVAIPCYSASGNIKDAITGLIEQKLSRL